LIVSICKNCVECFEIGVDVSEKGDTHGDKNGG